MRNTRRAERGLLKPAMESIAAALTALGRHGPTLLVVSLVLGVAAPRVSEYAMLIVPESALLLTLGSFLSAALAPREEVGRSGRLPIVLAFVGIGIPAATWAVLQAVHLAPAIETGVMVASLAPPVGSAAAIATMLALRPRLALAVSVILTLASPVLMPLAMAWAGLGLDASFAPVAYRLLVIVGIAAAITAAVMRWRSATSAILPSPAAAAGLSVIGLVITGLAVSSAVAPLAAERGGIADLFALSIALNVGACAVGCAIFLRWLGAREALTIGLLSGNRNVTLAWAVMGSSLSPDAQCYLAICVVPVRVLPFLIKAGHRALTKLRS